MPASEHCDPGHMMLGMETGALCPITDFDIDNYDFISQTLRCAINLITTSERREKPGHNIS